MGALQSNIMEKQSQNSVIIILLMSAIIGSIWFFASKPDRATSEIRLMMDTMVTIKAFGSQESRKRAIENGFKAFAEVLAKVIDMLWLRGGFVQMLSLVHDEYPFFQHRWKKGHWF